MFCAPFDAILILVLHSIEHKAPVAFGCYKSSATPNLPCISSLDSWPFWVSRKAVTQALIGNLFVLFHVHFILNLTATLGSSTVRAALGMLCSCSWLPLLGVSCTSVGSKISFHWKKRAFVKALSQRMAFCERPWKEMAASWPVVLEGIKWLLWSPNQRRSICFSEQWKYPRTRSGF